MLIAKREQDVLEKAQESLLALEIAWRNCQEAFDEVDFPEELVDSTKYPFEKSFGDYSIQEWVQASLENIEAARSEKQISEERE